MGGLELNPVPKTEELCPGQSMDGKSPGIYLMSLQLQLTFNHLCLISKGKLEGWSLPSPFAFT